MRTNQCICAFVLLVLATNAGAVAPRDIRPQLDKLVAAELLLSADGFMEPPGPARQEELSALLARDPRVAAAPELTRELVLRVVYENVVRHRTTVDEARSLVTHYTDSGSVPASKVIAHLVQLALPYAMDAGLCTGDPLSDEGVACAFAFAPAGAPEGTVSGSFGEGLGAVAVPMVEPGMLLFEVLSGCAPGDEACRELATPLLGSGETASGIGSALLAKAVHGWFKDFDYGRLLTLTGIGTAAAQTVYSRTWSGQDAGTEYGRYQSLAFRLDYGSGHYIRLRCGFYSGFSCDLWGEIVAAGNLKYLVSGSDMLIGVLPFAFHCPVDCVFTGMAGLAASWANDRWLGGSKTLDPQSFLTSNVDSVQLRNAGSVARHTARGACGVVPMPYENRPSHQAYKTESKDIPYGENFDLNPHTSFQMPPTDPLTPLLSHNMDPVPTRAKAELPAVSCNPLPIKLDFVWTYEFLLVSAWNPNVIFSALDNLNVINFCGADQIWQWYGAPGSGSKGLPALSWTFAFIGGHQPYLPGF